jgi:hypothetical protein
MSDSTLSGRSAALRKLNRLTKTKLPKGHGELPENFKYVWLELLEALRLLVGRWRQRPAR